jgi:hypothetical protein
MGVKNEIFISGGAGFIHANLASKLLTFSKCNSITIYEYLKSGSLRLFRDILIDSSVQYVLGISMLTRFFIIHWIIVIRCLNRWLIQTYFRLSLIPCWTFVRVKSKSITNQGGSL